MRRSFGGLSMLAEHLIGCNPLSGHLLVFANWRSDRLKILYRDRDGWAMWYKRLEVDTFQFPFAVKGRQEIGAWELAVLLEGIDLNKGKRRKRYSLPAAWLPAIGWRFACTVGHRTQCQPCHSAGLALFLCSLWATHQRAKGTCYR